MIRVLAYPILLILLMVLILFFLMLLLLKFCLKHINSIEKSAICWSQGLTYFLKLSNFEFEHNLMLRFMSFLLLLLLFLLLLLMVELLTLFSCTFNNFCLKISRTWLRRCGGWFYISVFFINVPECINLFLHWIAVWYQK